ncbi:MAG: PilZ domain-containing protein [Archangium sp.]|nr:PilZ domain-containing protein [Archangium sp.]
MSRVRFKHPIRVVTLEGQPRVIRTLTANVSRKGLFLRMPEPLPMGTKVALSLEAGGRALALAQAEVVWGREHESQLPGRFPGCGVRFTEFMHPRAEELVDYLVHNLDRGKPLMLAPPERRWLRWAPYAAGGALLACAVLATLLLWGPSDAEDLVDDAPGVAVVAEPPVVRSAPLPPVVMAPVTPSGVEGPPAAEEPKQPVVMAQPPPVTAAEELKQPAVMAQPPPASAPEEPKQPVVMAQPPPVTPSGVEGPPAEELNPVTGGASADAKRVGIVKESGLTEKRPLGKSRETADGKEPGAPKEQARLAPSSAPAAEKPVAVAKPKTGPAKDVQRGNLKLPSGAATSLTWTLAGADLRLSPELTAGAQVTHAFVLSGPPRAVFDLSGAAPLKSHVVPASPPYATAVRLGKQGAGTRIVVDLDSAPKRVSQDGAALVLTF